MRMDFNRAAPEILKAMSGLEQQVERSGLDKTLLNLVKFRASQINGCAYCLDMHSKEARAHGETEQRLYELDAWREAPFYSAREQAALAWTEAVTLITNGHVPDQVYQQVREQFKEEELANLTLAIVAINGWNRLSIAFRVEPGSYKPGEAGNQIKTERR
jgi:AhpD family alkylhydroperoxidase